jgi:hypothetical protein
MIQTILLILLVAAAVLYLGRRFFRQYTHPDSCGTGGCAKCGTKPDIKSQALRH